MYSYVLPSNTMVDDRAMKSLAPEYSGDDLNAGHDGGEHRKMTGESYCPSLLTDERTELFELQWRDGQPVEQSVLAHRSDVDDYASDVYSSGFKENTNNKAAGGVPKAGTLTGEAADDWWRLWREGEGGGACACACACAAPANYGYPHAADASSSPATVNAKKAARARGVETRGHPTADQSDEELWRLWREGHGSSTFQDSACKKSVLKGEESSLPSSAWSEGNGGAPMHSSEQSDQECSKLDHAIEYMKSLQQQIQVLSTSGCCMQPLVLPCNCASQYPRPAVYTAAAVGAAPPYPTLPPIPPLPAAAAATASLYPALPLPPGHPAVAANAADLNPLIVAVVGPAPAPGRVGACLADKMTRPGHV